MSWHLQDIYCFCNDLTKDRNENRFPQLVNIDTCGLYATHGAYNTGPEKSERKLKSIMKVSFSILHKSPTRWENYKSIMFAQQCGLKISLL